MLRLFRVLGKRGRITIPYEIRQRIGFRYNDVLSFTQQDDGSVVVRKEKSAITVMNLQKNMRKITPLKISLTVCPRKNRETHFCIFLCCGQKSRNTKSEVNSYGTEYKF